jgi:hypothetical protein
MKKRIMNYKPKIAREEPLKNNLNKVKEIREESEISLSKN